jgi:hypothetical protein
MKVITQRECALDAGLCLLRAQKIGNVITGFGREVVLAVDDGTDKLSGNFAKELPLYDINFLRFHHAV